MVGADFGGAVDEHHGGEGEEDGHESGEFGVELLGEFVGEVEGEGAEGEHEGAAEEEGVEGVLVGEFGAGDFEYRGEEGVEEWGVVFEEVAVGDEALGDGEGGVEVFELVNAEPAVEEGIDACELGDEDGGEEGEGEESGGEAGDGQTPEFQISGKGMGRSVKGGKGRVSVDLAVWVRM